jgi:DNA-binding LacI/PurR family transcriptional regulator
LTTIYDVAEHAGVSIATVSKVLSGRPYVSGATRERVLQSVNALGYVPSVAAQSLAGSRTNMIAVVIGYDPHDLFADPNLMQALHGIDSEITDRDFAMLLSCAQPGADHLSAFRRLLGGYRVDGVIVESGLGDEGVHLLMQRNYPCVIMGYSPLGLPCVHPDDYGGAQVAIRHLLELGHRRIGLIGGPPSNSYATQERLRGCQSALEQAGIAFDESLLTYGSWRAESGYEGAKQLMTLDPPPTALFGLNDRQALGAIRWLREHGYRVPEEVSVVGFDDIESAALWEPTLTTIRQSPFAIGQRAASMLFALIEDQELETRQVILSTELVVRQSTAPAAKT